jgi:hypothetical protein
MRSPIRNNSSAFCVSLGLAGLLVSGCHRNDAHTNGSVPVGALFTAKQVQAVDILHESLIPVNQQGTRAAWETWSPDRNKMLLEVITKDLVPGQTLEGGADTSGKAYLYDAETRRFTALADNVHGPFAWLPKGNQFVARTTGKLTGQSLAWFKIDGQKPLRSVDLPRNVFGVTGLVLLRSGADVAFAAQSVREEAVYNGVYRTTAAEVRSVAERSSAPVFSLTRWQVPAGDQLHWATLDTNGVAITITMHEALADGGRDTTKQIVMDPDSVKKAKDEDFTIENVVLTEDFTRAAVVVRAASVTPSGDSSTGKVTCYLVNTEEGSTKAIYTTPNAGALVIPRFRIDGKRLTVIDYFTDPPTLTSLDGAAPIATSNVIINRPGKDKDPEKLTPGKTPAPAEKKPAPAEKKN